MIADTVAYLAGLPPLLLYAVLAVGAALENIFPPIPSDTFVIAGGFLAARGEASPWGILLASWLGNVTSALLTYGAGYRYGIAFFRNGWGRSLLKEPQIARITDFYTRWGTGAIFISRFIPGVRAVVPIFAGVTRCSFLSVAIPLSIASALWHGALIWIGWEAGLNVDHLLRHFEEANRVLLFLVLLAGGVAAALWFRSRRRGRGE